MHDLIQDMGREIIRQESTYEPGKRSRLWFSKDIVHILEENKGTDTIEVIIVDLCKAKEVHWSGIGFKKMKNLRILLIENGRFSIGPQVLPNSLRVLDWSGYPSPSLPSNFNPKNLVILNLPESCLKLFKPFKVFESLSFMNFEGCRFLTQLPNLSGLQNLGALCLDDCTNLISLHDSVGFLNKLMLLTAQRCTQLEILVPCIYLTSLETLDLRGCSSLVNFPEVLGVMENVRDVYLDQTAINKLPFSIGNLVGLQRLFLRECYGLRQLPSSIHLLSKLEIIMDYGCTGYQLSEDKKKVCSEMLPKAILIYSIGISLDVYSLNINPNNAIQVCIPQPCPCFYKHFWGVDGCTEFLSLGYLKDIVNWYKLGSKESSIKFSFRKKLPKIALYCAGGPDMYEDNMAFMNFKLSVLINGDKPFTSSCNYIFSMGTMEEHILCCNLQCKVEEAFSEHDWNEVEILCEMDYTRPCDSERVMATKVGTTMKIPKWSLIYVCGENNMEDVKFKNHKLPLSLFLSQELCQMASIIDSQLRTELNKNYLKKRSIFSKTIAKAQQVRKYKLRLLDS